jgi:outer membrane protein OmpA-like peptidoglycan-associated protein
MVASMRDAATGSEESAQRDSGEGAVDTPDRDAILARRARLIASAMAALTGCAGAGEPVATVPPAAPAAVDAGSEVARQPDAGGRGGSWDERLGAIPPVDTPADVPEQEKPRFVELAERVRKIHEGLALLEASVPEGCPLLEASCDPSWSKLAADAWTLEIMIRGLTPMCGFGPAEHPRYVERASQHGSFASQRLGLWRARVSELSASSGKAAEGRWAQHAQRAMSAKPVPCLSCVSACDAQFWLALQFDAGSAGLPADAAKQLAEPLRMLRNDPASRIELQGHADGREGPAAKVAALAQQRADAVRAWMVTAGGDDSRLVARGFAADKPSGASRPDGSANRRVEVRITQRTGCP